MVGSQHHHIVNPLAVQLLEEVAKRAVERQQLDAHLATLRAIAVADIIGGRKADRQQVGGRSLAEPHLRAQGLGQGALVEVIQLAPHRQPVGKLGDPHRKPLEPLGDVVRGGLAFERGVHRQHHLVDAALADAVDQLADR